MNKTRQRFYVVVFATFVVGVMFMVALTHDADLVEASTTPRLEGTAYKTPSGSIVDLVQVPGIGKCLITSSHVVCKENK